MCLCFIEFELQCVCASLSLGSIEFELQCVCASLSLSSMCLSTTSIVFSSERKSTMKAAGRDDVLVFKKLGPKYHKCLLMIPND